MKKLILIIFVLSICVCPANAQIEFKTGPLHAIFTSPYIPNLYFEGKVNERIGLEVGGGIIDYTYETITLFNEPEEVRKKGMRGIIAAKYYFIPDNGLVDIYAGLYARPKRADFISNDIEKTSVFSLGVMTGFKIFLGHGFFTEVGGGIHSNTLIKTKYHVPDNTFGITARFFIGYQISLSSEKPS